MEKWEIDEADLGFNIMLHANYPALISTLHYQTQMLSLYGFFSLETVGFFCIGASFQMVFGQLRYIRNPAVKLWLVFYLFEMVQFLLLVLMLLWSPENFALHLINSTVILVVAELSPIHSAPFNLALIVKHIVMWVFVAWFRGIPGEIMSLVPTVWILWNLHYLLTHKRMLLKDKQRAEEEKEIEKMRLKALLEAMPDGVVVFSDSLEVLSHNPAISTQLGVEIDCKTTACIQMMIGKLSYDPEYCSPEEDIYRFKQDLGSALDMENGVVRNFKPLLYAGKHLECRGCVTLWDDKKVLILTIRDTSNWAQLEKAAKKDSANKTALIRSVSHELRTPVNAIINLCQDLQASPSLGDQERADVEVLTNASSFLLSMINDLLDYSRILHDKFELGKTSFDLEQLIRSCGALLALQCKQKQLNFSVRFDPLLPKFAYTDENRLKQVILNLLSNAVK